MDSIVNVMTGLLNMLYHFSSALGFANYGIAIILLTVLIKSLIYPLTYKQMSSMRKMVDLQPKIKAIQEKHKNNKEKANAAVMEFYKEIKLIPWAVAFLSSFRCRFFSHCITLYSSFNMVQILPPIHFYFLI